MSSTNEYTAPLLGAPPVDSDGDSPMDECIHGPTVETLDREAQDTDEDDPV